MELVLATAVEDRLFYSTNKVLRASYGRKTVYDN